MARDEQPREDLLAEATALTTRVEFTVSGNDTVYVGGFRNNGAFSLFCGEDPVFQFNTRGELRRAFWHGCLLKAEQRALIQLRRHRTAEQVQLVRHALTDAEAAEVIGCLAQTFGYLQQAWHRGEVLPQRQVSPEGDALVRVMQWIETAGKPIPLAASPRVVAP